MKLKYCKLKMVLNGIYNNRRNVMTKTERKSITIYGETF